MLSSLSLLILLLAVPAAVALSEKTPGTGGIQKGPWETYFLVYRKWLEEPSGTALDNLA